jgi:hypothetical protein
VLFDAFERGVVEGPALATLALRNRPFDPLPEHREGWVLGLDRHGHPVIGREPALFPPVGWELAYQDVLRHGLHDSDIQPL